MYHIRAPNDITDITACENGMAESQFVSVFVCFGAADKFFFHGNCKKDLRHTRNVQSRLQDIHAAHRQLFRPPRVATAPSTLSGLTSHLPGAATGDQGMD